MRILHVTDLHACSRCMKRVIGLYKEIKADLLVFSGDISGKCVCDERCYCLWGHLDPSTDYVNRGGYKLRKGDPSRNLPGTLVAHAFEETKEWVENLVENDIETILIGGNLDHPLIDEAFYKYYPDPRKGVEVRGLKFLGVDVVPYTPFGTFREGSEERIKELLVEKADILVSHSPPYGILDLAGGSHHVGSKAVLEYIKSSKPFLTLHGHIHESWGFENVDGTVVVNAGSQAYEGVLRYAIIDIDEHVKKVRNVDLRVEFNH